MTAPSLPPPVDALAAELARLPGAVGVVLGGSRATGAHRPDSDWDLLVYYRASRRALDPEAVRRLGHPGHVSPLDAWGPIVNGGAWLTVDGLAVDVLFRDLETLEAWLAEAQEGRFTVLPQNGHLVGAPTYHPAGELALARPLSGDLPRPAFPAPLARTAPAHWQGEAATALMFAEAHATADDPVCCAGMLARAILCTAHGRLAGRGEWALNEKRLVQRAGLAGVQAVLAAPGTDATRLAESVAAVSAALDVAPLSPR